MNNKTINIAFADDNAQERELIKTAIEQMPQFKVVVAANHGRDLLGQLFWLKKKKKNLPEIILLDIQMPCCDGLTTCIVCKWFFPEIKIVGISVHTNAAVISQMVKEGADGFLSKFIVQPNSIVYKAYNTCSPFLHALEQVLAGQLFIDEILDELNLINYIGSSCREILTNKFSFLKNQNVSYIMLNAAGFKRKEIAEMLNCSEATVKLIICQLNKHFNTESHEDIYKYAVMNGLIKTVELYQKTPFKSIVA